MIDFAVHIVDSRSEQSQSLDPTSVDTLVKTSETIGGILPLTGDNDMAKHERGIFAVDGQEAVGYAAHRYTEDDIATIGSLLVTRTGNGRGGHIGHLLVAGATLAAFENPAVQETRAWCTPKSHKIFAGLGYSATGEFKLGVCGQEKTQVRLTREELDGRLLFMGVIPFRTSQAEATLAA